MKFSFCLIFIGFLHTFTFGQTFQSIDPDGFSDMLGQYHEVALIDVRTDGEVATGKIPGAKHIDIRRRDFDNQVRQYDPNTPIFVYCAVGGRSLRAAQRLVSLGFTRVYDLKGGITAWREQGKPIEK